MPKNKANTKQRKADLKKRAVANRVGERGEKKFDAVSSDYGVVATPFKNDYGFDFICQIDEDPYAKAPSGLVGQLVAVSVRTTIQPSGRIKLTRADADALLRAQFVTMVALVHLPRSGPEELYVRLLDTEFRKELGAFLQSKRDSVSFRPHAFQPISHIREVIEPAMKPGFVAGSRLEAAIAGLAPKMPGIELTVTQTADGTWVAATADNLFSLFTGSEFEDRDLRYLTAFGAPSRMADRLKGLEVDPSSTTYAKELSGDLILGGTTTHKVESWLARDDEGSELCSMDSILTPDHTGWRHEAGWSLVVSRSVERDGVRVHELRAFADPDEHVELAAHPDLDAFPRRCTENAKLGLEDWDPLPFDAWAFRDLARYHMLAIWLREVRKHASGSRSFAYLRDALDDETMWTLEWLYMLDGDKQAGNHLPGFMIADHPGEPNMPCELTVPVLLNTATASLIARLSCDGLLAISGVDLVGVKIVRVLDYSVEVMDRFEKATAYPEFGFDPDLVLVAGRSTWELLQGTPYPGLPIEMEVTRTDAHPATGGAS